MRRIGDDRLQGRRVYAKWAMMGRCSFRKSHPAWGPALPFRSEAAALQHVALENPDGRQMLVVTNPGSARTIEVRIANLAAVVPVKTNSVTTPAWDSNLASKGRAA